MPKKADKYSTKYKLPKEENQRFSGGKKLYGMKKGGMSKKEYNDMVDKKIKSREETIKKFEKAREDFDLRRKAKEKSTSDSLEKQREEFYKKLEKKKSGGSVKNKFKDNPEDRFGKYRSTTAKKGKMIKADELDDELGSPPGAENYQKMYDQPESMGGDPKKRIMPKKKPKEFKKKDKPVTMILEKETIEFIGKNKKAKGGLMKGFPRLAKKGF